MPTAERVPALLPPSFVPDLTPLLSQLALLIAFLYVRLLKLLQRTYLSMIRPLTRDYPRETLHTYRKRRIEP